MFQCCVPLTFKPRNKMMRAFRLLKVVVLQFGLLLATIAALDVIFFLVIQIMDLVGPRRFGRYDVKAALGMCLKIALRVTAPDDVDREGVFPVGDSATTSLARTSRTMSGPTQSVAPTSRSISSGTDSGTWQGIVSRGVELDQMLAFSVASPRPYASSSTDPGSKNGFLLSIF
jgi:hypothetical protein